jgi:hypothetical protein
MITHVLIYRKHILVSTIDEEVDVKVLKQLLPKMSTLSDRGIIRFPGTTTSIYYLKENNEMGSTIYLCLSSTFCFEFLERILFDFQRKPEYHIRSTRPYSHMKLEPWLTRLKREFLTKNGKISGPTTMYDIGDILPSYKPIAQSVRSIPEWNYRISIMLYFALIVSDVYLFLSSPWNLHHVSIVILGLLSPVYLLLASIEYLQRSVTRISAHCITLHIIITFFQILYTILIPRPDYHKPTSPLTTLQQYANFFGSFEIHFVIILLKLIYVLIILQTNYTILTKQVKSHIH